VKDSFQELETTHKQLYCTNKVFNHFERKVDDRIFDILEKVHANTDKFKEKGKQIANIQDNIFGLRKSKIDHSHLESLKQEMKDRFCLYTDLKELYGKVLPPIKKFQEQMQEYSMDHTKMHMIIR